MGDLIRAVSLAAGVVASLAMTNAQPTPVNAHLWVERLAQPATTDYVSPVHDVPAGFRTAVVSWNAQTPAGAWIEFWMRARIGSRWTSWYAMGDWSSDYRSAHRHSIAQQSDPDGHVDVDTLRLNANASALQVKAMLHPGEQQIAPVLRSIAVTTDSDQAPTTADDHTAWGADIDVPQRTQRVMESPDGLGGGGDAWCSPTSVSMVMAYWAKALRHPEWDIDVPTSAKGTYDPVYDGCGNWPFNVAYASEHGLAGWVERLDDLTDIQRYISSGVPVIASIKVARGEMDGTPYPSSDGHLLVVCGFDARGDVIVNDPYGLPGAIRRVYRRDQFARAWKHGSGGIVYIIAPPGLLEKLR